MNANDLYFGSEFLRWFVVIGFAIYSYQSNRASAKQAVVTELSSRLIVIESDMKHMPSRHQISLLFERLGKLEAEIEGLSEQLRPINTSLDRINDYLLRQR